MKFELYIASNCSEHCEVSDQCQHKYYSKCPQQVNSKLNTDNNHLIDENLEHN